MLALLALVTAPLQLPVDGWVAFDQPAVNGTERMGCGRDGKASLMDDDDAWHIIGDEQPGRYETFTVYLEMRDGEPRQLRTYTPDCTVGGAESAKRVELGAADAVELLSAYLAAPGSDDIESRLVAAIAHIGHDRAGKALANIAEDIQDEDRSETALFWLAQRRGTFGRRVVTAHLGARWPLEHREHAVMSLALSEHPEALVTVRDSARRAEPAALRAQAVVALGITDAPGALADLHSIFLVEKDEQVREQAVFAMSQIESEHAAQILADIVREPRNGELRRTALFWLAQMPEESSQETLDALIRDVL